MAQLARFVDAVRKGEVPSPESLEAAATAIDNMLVFQAYHYRQRTGVVDDLWEAEARNPEAARRLLQRTLTTLQHPIVASEHHAVLVGGAELIWLKDLLQRLSSDEKGSVKLIPGRGRHRVDAQRRLEQYAASVRDDAGLTESQALEATEIHRRATPDLRYSAPINDRDRFRKDLLAPGREMLGRRKRPR